MANMQTGIISNYEYKARANFRVSKVIQTQKPEAET
jgi:hypothetical protein